MLHSTFWQRFSPQCEARTGCLQVYSVTSIAGTHVDCVISAIAHTSNSPGNLICHAYGQEHTACTTRLIRKCQPGQRESRAEEH